MEKFIEGIREWVYGLESVEEFLEREEMQIRLLELNTEISSVKAEV